MLATPSEYVTCSFACPVSFSASVQPGFALFNCFSSSCLALSLAPSLESDFSLFSCFSAWRSRSRLLWSLTSLSSALAWHSRSRLLWSLTSLFSCFSSSCLSLSLAPSLKPFLLALILFTIHLEYRWITNTHLELGFLSTSEMSTVIDSIYLRKVYTIHYRAVATGPVSPVSTGPLFPSPWLAWRRQIGPMLGKRHGTHTAWRHVAT